MLRAAAAGLRNGPASSLGCHPYPSRLAVAFTREAAAAADPALATDTQPSTPWNQHQPIIFPVPERTPAPQQTAPTLPTWHPPLTTALPPPSFAAAASFPALDFNDPEQALKHKSTVGLCRSLAVLRACRIRWLVSNADALLAGSKKVLGTGLINFLIKQTFYKQFVGGANTEELRPLMNHLSSHGIGAVLDYAAEDDVSEEGGPASRQPPTDTVVARTYSYENEAACDRRLEVFLQSIEAAQLATPEGQQGCAAIKLTALGNPALLERVSIALLAVQSLFAAFDEDGDGTISKDEFERGYQRLFQEMSNEPRPLTAEDGVVGTAEDPFSYDWLDTDRDGRVDYVAFTKRVTLADAARIAAHCREKGPFAQAALSTEELRLVDATLKRIETIAEAAASRGVRLLVDAEHSYFQPAIDAAVSELQLKYNRDVPLIYGTYQCYRNDVHERMAVDIERARREGYKFGCKLVRGAYMELERQRAHALDMPSPIWDTIEQTHTAYDQAVAAMLPLVRDEGAEMMVASHNQGSIEAAVAGMEKEGLPPSSPVSFGQLLGMADHLTFLLGRNGFRAYKYVTYGEVELVMPYLIRRAQENSSVLGGTAVEEKLMRKELRRRILG